MPELAEVEFSRKQWDPCAGTQVDVAVVNAGKRVFRGTAVAAMVECLNGAVFESSWSGGKQMLFSFSGEVWVGIHLGMTGELRLEPSDYIPDKHDHFLLRMNDGRQLVFNDPRQFGRVLFAQCAGKPDWWLQQAPSLLSSEFNQAALQRFLTRRGKAPIKAVLLMQERFPGVGNWMADEILWRAKLSPSSLSGDLGEETVGRLWRQVRFVCRGALRSVGQRGGDPPRGWLFHERWTKKGRCPMHRTPLRYETIGGRTTAWCVKCQKGAG